MQKIEIIYDAKGRRSSLNVYTEHTVTTVEYSPEALKNAEMMIKASIKNRYCIQIATGICIRFRVNRYTIYASINSHQSKHNKHIGIASHGYYNAIAIFLNELKDDGIQSQLTVKDFPLLEDINKYGTTLASGTKYKFYPVK